MVVGWLRDKTSEMAALAFGFVRCRGASICVGWYLAARQARCQDIGGQVVSPVGLGMNPAKLTA